MLTIVFKDLKGDFKRGALPTSDMSLAKEMIKQDLSRYPSLATGEIWDGNKRVAVYKLEDGELVYC
jgi:hypothetical protein